MLPDIPGIEDVIEYFGEWPSFHDAEVLELHLERNGRSWMKINQVRGTRSADTLQAVIRFNMDGITDLELADFSIQNVIGGLDLEETSKGIRLTMIPCYGLAGFLEAKQISVELSSGKIS